MVHFSFGILLIILAVINTISLWIFSKTDFGLVLQNPLTAFNQIFALIGLVLLSIEYILAARFNWLEKLFAGLDNVYKIHHIVGGLAFIFMLFHPTFLILNALPNFKLAFMYLIPSSNVAYSLGVLSLYLFIVLLTMTFYVRLPYDYWKTTHNFLGIPLLLVGLHVMLITSDVSRYAPLRWWVLSFIIVALGSFIYKRFFYRLFSHKITYQVGTLKLLTNIVLITLNPLIKTLKFKPGQFIFITFGDRRVSKELHPFSITSSPDSKQLGLAIRIVGDWTAQLASISPSTSATVYGPYGRFGDEFLYCQTDMTWIAGGIGITPFLSMLHYEMAHPTSRKIKLYYCTKSKEDNVFDEEIKYIIKDATNIEYINHCSSEKGRVKADNMLPENTRHRFFFCGPPPMMHSLTEQYIQMGVHPRNLIMEDFDFKPV